MQEEPQASGHDAAMASPRKEWRTSMSSKLFGAMARSAKASTWAFGMLWFDDKIDIEEVHELVRTKTLKMPRFRSKQVEETMDFVELDPEQIDLSYHVVEVTRTLSPEQIQDEYIGDMFRHFKVDFERPLWRFYLFNNVSDGRTLLLSTISHSIGDGMSLIEVVFRMVDHEEEPAEEPAETGAALTDAEPKRRRRSRLLAALRAPPRRAVVPSFGPLNRVRIFASGIYETFNAVFGPADTPNPVMRADVLQPSPIKSVAMTESIPLAQVKGLKAKFPGTTVNDILVALLSLTLRAYFSECGDAGKDALAGNGIVRASFPINGRGPGEAIFREGSPYNAAMLGVLHFPLGASDPLDLVWEVKRMLDGIKVSPYPYLITKLAGVVSKFRTKTDPVDQILQLYCNNTVMLSNVPGPQSEVRIMGRPMVDLGFFLYNPTSLYLGLMSFAGRVSCSVCLDGSLGEASDLARHWKPQFDALYAAAMAVDGPVPRNLSLVDRL